MLKVFLSFFGLFFFAVVSSAQTGDVLATASNQNFTAADLPAQIADNYNKLPQIIKDLRTELLAQQIADRLLAAEAAARKTTVENLVATEVRAKVPAPTEAQIQAIYNANKNQIGDKTLAEVRPQIVNFLRQEPEQKGLIAFIAQLRTKYKAQLLKDINAPLLQPSDTVASIDGVNITAKEFEEKAAASLYETREIIYEQTSDALDQTILSSLLNIEAKALGLQSQDIIAREVTDKMKDFTDAERENLQSALEKRLYQKYNVKVLLKEPAAYRQNIAVLPTNPSRGNVNAPITVIMFSDFQCPACSAAHPVLDQVLAEYADKIHLVVRNFPLVNLHKNAYNAALAAAAANAQGKFFEYTDVLYKNQENLDVPALKKYAADLGLNQQQFNADLDSKKYEADVKKDIADGNTYGINGTPTIYVNGLKVRQLSADGFRWAIKQSLPK